MKFLKLFIRGILRMIDPDLEFQAVEQFHFNQLGRTSPELMWKALRPGPHRRLDAGGLQLEDKLYVFGGYETPDHVLSVVDVYDLKRNRWSECFEMPENMQQNHLGMICDGKRFMYSVSGQLGNQCHPPSPNCFALDTHTQTWTELPSLPEARYAPTVQLWQERLHAIGGSKHDRNTPGIEHWSIAVKDGQALEDCWRTEPSIPRGGPHRGSAVLNDHLYVFGGQEGDYIATPGDPKYVCTGDLTCEDIYNDTYRLARGANQWQRLADMPVKTSHTEFSTVVRGSTAVLLGGQHYKDPQTKIIELTDVVQVYNADTDTWKVAGRMPYRSKAVIVAYYDGYLYFTTGQCDKGVDDPTPGLYDNRAWKAKFSLNGS